MQQFQWLAVAFLIQVAVSNLATFSVVDTVAVAQIQAVSCTEPPDRVLYEPWENLGEIRVESAGIDPDGDSSDDFGAAARPVAGSAVVVRRAAILKDAGPVQEVMNEGVYGNHGFAGLKPSRALCPGTAAG